MKIKIKIYIRKKKYGWVVGWINSNTVSTLWLGVYYQWYQECKNNLHPFYEYICRQTSSPPCSCSSRVWAWRPLCWLTHRHTCPFRENGHWQTALQEGSSHELDNIRHLILVQQHTDDVRLDIPANLVSVIQLTQYDLLNFQSCLLIHGWSMVVHKAVMILDEPLGL